MFILQVKELKELFYILYLILATILRLNHNSQQVLLNNFENEITHIFYST
jgi:hypothetical protein